MYDIVLGIMENGIASGSNSITLNIILVLSPSPILLIPTLVGKGLTLITAGNKIFVSTDWTMFGNLGYGVLARNNARCELVSSLHTIVDIHTKQKVDPEVRRLNGPCPKRHIRIRSRRT